MVDSDVIYAHLCDALNNGDVGDVVSLLRDNDVDIDYRDVTHDLQTFLMRVCYVNIETEELLEILEAIFDHSPDVNIKDSWGRTVLMHACIANKPVVIEGLLEYENTDISQVDFEGNSVLSFAVQNCDVYTLEDILKHPCGPKLLSIHNFKGRVLRIFFYWPIDIDNTARL
jgi:ankyrin repeat protein